MAALVDAEPWEAKAVAKPVKGMTEAQWTWR